LTIFHLHLSIFPLEHGGQVAYMGSHPYLYAWVQWAKITWVQTTLNIVFSVTHYLELHNAYNYTKYDT
jgi:hypothetical protein